MKETDTHIYFWGGWMSNFHPCNVVLFNHVWLSSEHAYMAGKANHFGDFNNFVKILCAPTAKEAKALGRQVEGFDAEEWHKVSYDYMHKAVLSKFIHNEKLATKLKNTGTKILVEASPLDKIWGVGLHETNDLILDQNNWQGSNWLGNVLMGVRTVL